MIFTSTSLNNSSSIDSFLFTVFIILEKPISTDNSQDWVLDETLVTNWKGNQNFIKLASIVSFNSPRPLTFAFLTSNTSPDIGTYLSIQGYEVFVSSNISVYFKAHTSKRFKGVIVATDDRSFCADLNATGPCWVTSEFSLTLGHLAPKCPSNIFRFSFTPLEIRWNEPRLVTNFSSTNFFLASSSNVSSPRLFDVGSTTIEYKDNLFKQSDETRFICRFTVRFDRWD